MRCANIGAINVPDFTLRAITLNLEVPKQHLQENKMRAKKFRPLSEKDK
jgi:hypothetical protein